MTTIESTLRESEMPLAVALSARQMRLREVAARLEPSAGMLTCVAVLLPNALAPSACIETLRRLCMQVESLRACAVEAGGKVQWELDTAECAGSPLQLLPPTRADLTTFLSMLPSDPLAPLTVSYTERPEARRWLLGVGAARCDLAGLEQLVARWAEVLAGEPALSAGPPGLVAVHHALAGASESAEARSAQAYWNRHVDSADRQPAFEGSIGTPACRSAFAPREVRLEGLSPLLQSLQERYAVSTRTLLLAAWIVLVNRISGTSKATFWVQFEGRLAPRLKEFVGRLAHSVPLSLRLQQSVSCNVWMRDVDRVITMHERLQDSYSPDAATLGATDFQFVFREPLSEKGGASILHRMEGGEPFRLKLSSDVAGDRCDVVLHYDASEVRAVQAQSLARYFEKLLRVFSEPSLMLSSACASASSALAPILQAERGPMRPEWIVTEQLGQMLSQGLRGCRVFASDARSEDEAFESRVLRRVRLLRRTCTGARKMLALVAPTSVDAAVTVVAAMIAGVPVGFVDPRWPVSRRQSALEQVEATLLIGLQESVQDLTLDGPTLSFEALAQMDDLPNTPAVDPAALGGAEPDEIAYVVFSSGSTKVPKPIVIPRGALQNQMLWLRERIPLDARDVVLHRTPLGFDAAVWELLHPICSGATLVIAAHETGSDPRTILREVAKHSVTVLQVTPHLLRAMHEEPAFGEVRSLRFVVVGGDRLPIPLALNVSQSSKFEVVNAYGPSECCIQVSIGNVSAEHFAAGMASAPIGLPMPNSGLHILSDELEPLLDGCVGRLFVSGTPLAHAYAWDAAGTAGAFLPLPVDDAAGARMYNTGDLARRVRGADIEIFGRIDKQMKLNGVRVDLLTIEKALHEVDQVVDAAVITTRDEYGAGYLTAFIVTHGDSADVTKRARMHVENSMPPTSQPAHYICLPKLPLTDRGKIDSEALRKAAVEVATPPSVPPRTLLEETIASVWREMLKRDAVGVHDDFFLAGGHSLLFAQVITRLRQALSLEISLRAIFMHPTIALLAEHIEGLQRDAGAR